MKDPEIKPGMVPGRCNARARTSPTGWCRAFPLAGGDHRRCKNHGGRSEGRPSATLVHGRTSAFIRRDQLPEVVEIVEKLATTDGRVALLKTGIAVSELRAESVDVTDHTAYQGYRNTIRNDIGAILTLERKEAPAAVAPVFQIANFGDSNNGVVLARTLDGHAKVQFVNGRPYLLDERDGTLFPAVEKTEADTGATYYERMPVAGAP